MFSSGRELKQKVYNAVLLLTEEQGWVKLKVCLVLYMYEILRGST